MRTLHIIATLAPITGGPAKVAFEMARAEARLGIQSSVFTSHHHDPRPEPFGGRVEKREGVKIRYFPLGFPHFWATSWPMAIALREELRSTDIVIVHSLYLFHDFVAATLCRRMRVPYLVLPHGSLEPYIYRQHRWRKAVAEVLFNNRLLRNSAGILFTSALEKTLGEQYTFGTKGFVVRLGIDLADYQPVTPPGSFRARYPETQGRRIILFLSRLDPKKGLDILIESFSKVLAVQSDIHLVIAGPDFGIETQIRAWLETKNLMGRVTFTGMITSQDKLALLQDADVFVLPSHSENFGIGVVEAMHFGMPVLVSDQVNLWLDVVEAGAGLAAPCNPQAFADILSQVLSDRDLARDMGRRGQALVQDKFTWDVNGRLLEKVYNEVIASQSTRGLLSGVAA